MMSRVLKSFLAARDGATAVEYGLLAGLIALGLLTGLAAFSGSLENIFKILTAAIENAGK